MERERTWKGIESLFSPVSFLRGQRFMRFFDRIEEIIGVACMGTMVTIAFVNVIARYFLKFSFAFTEELTIYLFVWATMMGASIAFRDGSHIVVSIVYNRLGLRGRKVLDILHLLLTVIFFGILTYYSTLEVADEIVLKVQTEAVSLPVWWFTIAMPISSLLIIWRVILQTFDKIHTPGI